MAMRRLENYQPTPFMLPTSRYCQEAADHAVAFIEDLPHTKGKWKGQKFQLIDWQEQIIRDVFGVLKPDGFRQFNTAYIEIPKKQGKSELGAAISLLLLCGDFEPSAEIYGCAGDRPQASIVFDVARDMVRMHPYLSRAIKVKDSIKRLEHKQSGSFYQVLSAESGTKHGFNVHGVVFDELHAQPNRKLYDVITAASGDVRDQPLFFTITTAGNDMNSIGYEVHSSAEDILAGHRKDPTFYPVIYGASDEDDWTDPAVWRKANPSLDITVPLSRVEAMFEAAKGNATAENNFRQLRLNQWVSAATRWMPMFAWRACGNPVDRAALKGRACYAGLDLASTQDTTALVLVFPPHESEENGKYHVLAFFWLPEARLAPNIERDNIRYDDWVRDKVLETTPGDVTDYSFVRARIHELAEEFDLREIATDPHNARHLIQELQGDGLNVLEFRQGAISLSPPMKELMRFVFMKKLVHGGNPMLDWQMDNLAVVTDANENIRPVKGKKRSGRIDGCVSLFMALDRAIMRQDVNQASAYDTKGEVTFI